MKKLFLVALALILSVSAFSQNYKQAIGQRLGTSIGASYKHFLNSTQAIEGILDLDIFEKDQMKIKATGIYQFHFDVNVDGLALYAGPGASVGLFLGDTNGVHVAIDGMAGIEYKFDNVPLALSFDWNPKVQIITNAGFKPANFGLTLRYTF